MSGGRGPDGTRPRDGAGRADVAEFCEPDFFRQPERRLADVGAEDANRFGGVPEIRPRQFVGDEFVAAFGGARRSARAVLVWQRRRARSDAPYRAAYSW